MHNGEDYYNMLTNRIDGAAMVDPAAFSADFDRIIDGIGTIGQAVGKIPEIQKLKQDEQNDQELRDKGYREFAGMLDAMYVDEGARKYFAQKSGKENLSDEEYKQILIEYENGFKPMEGEDNNTWLKRSGKNLYAIAQANPDLDLETYVYMGSMQSVQNDQNFANATKDSIKWKKGKLLIDDFEKQGELDLTKIRSSFADARLEVPEYFEQEVIDKSVKENLSAVNKLIDERVKKYGKADILSMWPTQAAMLADFENVLAKGSNINVKEVQDKVWDYYNRKRLAWDGDFKAKVEKQKLAAQKKAQAATPKTNQNIVANAKALVDSYAKEMEQMKANFEIANQGGAYTEGQQKAIDDLATKLLGAQQSYTQELIAQKGVLNTSAKTNPKSKDAVNPSTGEFTSMQLARTESGQQGAAPSSVGGYPTVPSSNISGETPLAQSAGFSIKHPIQSLGSIFGKTNIGWTTPKDIVEESNLSQEDAEIVMSEFDNQNIVMGAQGEDGKRPIYLKVPGGNAKPIGVYDESAKGKQKVTFNGDAMQSALGVNVGQQDNVTPEGIPASNPSNQLNQQYLANFSDKIERANNGYLKDKNNNYYVITSRGTTKALKNLTDEQKAELDKLLY